MCINTHLHAYAVLKGMMENYKEILFQVMIKTTIYVMIKK